MIDYSIKIKELTKLFGRRLVFRNIDGEFRAGNIYGIAGKNGAGKSTFVKILAGVLSPTSGSAVHYKNDKKISHEKIFEHLGFVSPYLILYDEFTAEENLIHFSRIRGEEYDTDYANALLKRFGLYKRRKDLLKNYSSGMKQRMKFVFALLHKPFLLILDEPTSNLDENGKETVYEIIREQGKERLVIVASNEERDLSLCAEILNLEDYKKREAEN
jgi:heme exporter protein A